jgi:hypothetical protein
VRKSSITILSVVEEIAILFAIEEQFSGIDNIVHGKPYILTLHYSKIFL